MCYAWFASDDMCAPEKISKTNTRTKSNVRARTFVLFYFLISYKITNNHMCMVVGVILYTTYDHKYYVQIYKIKYTGYWWSVGRYAHVPQTHSGLCDVLSFVMGYAVDAWSS